MMAKEAGMQVLLVVDTAVVAVLVAGMMAKEAGMQVLLVVDTAVVAAGSPVHNQKSRDR